jgi:hypothetical protein
MKINKPDPTHFITYEPRPGKALAPASYKIGQILNAIVLSNSHQGRVAIRIGNMELTASTNIALQQNTPLELKVAQLQPKLQLQRLLPGGGNPLHEAMLKMLPQQTSLAPLLAELVFKAQAKQHTAAPAPPQAAIKNLLAALPTRQDIRQADGLQRAVAQSGLFLEAKLATAASSQRPALATDLKSLLLRYLDTLQQSRSEQAVTRPATQPAVQPATQALHTRPTTTATPATPPGQYGAALTRQTTTAPQQPASGQPQTPEARLAPNTVAGAAVRTATSPVPGAPARPVSAPPPGPAAPGNSLHAELKATLASERVSAEVPPPLRGRLPQPQRRVSHVAPTPAGAIETHHPALLKQLEGALARIGLHQVATAENFNEGQNLWQLEIPVRHGNTVEIVALTIEKETARNSPDTEDEDAWYVNLSLDLPNLGSLQSRISMDKQGLSTTFWTRSRHNLSLIENRLPELRRNLELHGLEINQFKCIDGQQPTAHAAKANGSLIDYQI